MSIRSIRDAALTVKGRRTDLGLSQEELARRAGVSRKWIYEFEAGKPSAEIGHVIRVLDALDLRLDVSAAEKPSSTVFDLDALLKEYGGS